MGCSGARTYLNSEGCLSHTTIAQDDYFVLRFHLNVTAVFPDSLPLPRQACFRAIFLYAYFVGNLPTGNNVASSKA